MQMTPFKYFWICSSLIILSGCSGFQTKTYNLSGSKSDFMPEYCQSGRQVKALKTSVIYFAPNLEKGIPLDLANQKNKILSDQKNELLKQLFYLLGNSSPSEQVANHGDKSSWYLLSSENESDVIKNIANEDSDTKYRLFTFIVKILNQNKVIVYQSNKESRRMNYDKSYAADLNNLMNDYTLLAPKKVMEEITGEEFDDRSAYSTIILNENGEIDLSKAIENRGRLWRAYIAKFTSKKEATADNSNKSTVELTLDLNAFCKYGRKISDIQSQ